MRVTRLAGYRWVLLVAALALVLAACGTAEDAPGTVEQEAPSAGEDAPEPEPEDAPEPEPEGHPGGTLEFGIDNDVVHFDPALLPRENFVMMPQLFNTLISLDLNVEPQPSLVSAWEFSDDLLTMTLTIRDDVVFHDGTAMTAADVVWNIERYQDPETGANARVLLSGITNVEAVDDTTVVLTFDAPQAAIFDGLDLIYVVKPADNEQIRTTPVGTGPFMLEDHAPGDRLVFVRNEDYWRDGLPTLDRINLRVLPDGQGRVISLETGEIHLADNPPVEELDRLRGTDGIEVLLATSPAVVSDLMINVEAGPFQDKRVRQAVHHAMDRARIVDLGYAGQSEPWCLPWPTGSPAFTDAARDCPRDVDLARDLLAQAGFADGFAVTLDTTGIDLNVTIAQIIQSNLEEIGIEVTIRQDEGQELRERSGAGDYEFRVHGFGRANRDPASLLTTTVVWRPDGNWPRYESDEYTNLVRAIAETVDASERAGMFDQLNALLLEEMFVISIAPDYAPYAYLSGIEGFSLNLDGMPVLERVILPQD